MKIAVVYHGLKPWFLKAIMVLWDEYRQCCEAALRSSWRCRAFIDIEFGRCVGYISFSRACEEAWKVSS
jgi:hypothetical protein